MVFSVFKHSRWDVVVYSTVSDGMIDHHRLKGAWRYQVGNRNLQIEEGQKTQWSNEKGKKNIQRSTKHTYKANDRVTRTTLKSGDKLRCSGTVGISCSTFFFIAWNILEIKRRYLI